MKTKVTDTSNQQGLSQIKQHSDYATNIRALSEAFVEQAIKERGKDITSSTCANLSFTKPLEPVLIQSYSEISPIEKDTISNRYHEFGGAYIISENNDESQVQNPIFLFAESMKTELNLKFPLEHPLEGHPEAIKRFGPNDHTFKIYDLPKEDGGISYKEVAETSRAFEVHQDGLGSGGTVQTFILYSHSAPLFGGYTFVYDITKLSMCLRNIDRSAFESLFQPDAITAVRPRGKGSIKITSPILYLDEENKVHSFFRKSSGEYVITFKNDPNLHRAIQLLNKHTEPFANGSVFANYTAGSMLVVKNRDFAHGRTAFIDGSNQNTRRLLSRKWYMTSEEHQKYKHVPGIFALPDYEKMFNGIFTEENLQGEWNYVNEIDANVRIK